MAKSETKAHHLFIVTAETAVQAWARDASTYALALALILPGWLLGSSAMQWIGFIVFFMTTFTKASGLAKRLTADEARAKIDGIDP